MSKFRARHALQALADQRSGRLTPEGVIDAAAHLDSPLHSYFTWDDREAAHEHRLNQARKLLASIRFEVTTSEHTFSAPVFIRDPAAERQQGYVTVARLRTEEDLAREAVVNEFMRASSALTRAKAVAAVLDLSDEVEGLLVGITTLMAQAQQPGGTA